MKFYLRALGYFRDDSGQIGLSFGLILLLNILGVLWPVPLALFFAIVKGEDTHANWLYRLFSWVPREQSLTMVLMLAGAMLVMRLGTEVIRTVQTQLSIRIGYSGRARVQADLFQKLQALSLKYHKSQPQGDAIYRLSYDTHGFHGVLGTMLGIVINIGSLVVMLITMLLLNWKLTVIALLVVPALYFTITQWSKTLYRYALRQKEADQEVTTQIQRSLAVVSVVQAFNREQDELERFESRQSTYIAASLRLHWQEILYWLVLGSILSIGSVALFAYGGYLVIQQQMGVGVLFLFITYLGQLYDPLSKLSGANAGLQSARAGVTRVFEVLDQDPIITDQPGAQPLPVQPRRIELEDVHFSYRDTAPVLMGLSCAIEPGQMVAFVGESGVGKTTLLSLLPRFYDPTGGRVLMDGIDARTVRVRDLRKHVALVLQDSVILPTTVAENIAYGRPGASIEEIRQAARLAGAAKFIDQLESGYQTVISEAGSNLSGGQKQRISIARALCTNAPVVVLDEPTSALDPQHESAILETLKTLKGKRTVILVSHRLSTVADCDQIFVMDAGRIVERGRHHELLALRGLYWTMARTQLRLDESGQPKSEPGKPNPQPLAAQGRDPSAEVRS